MASSPRPRRRRSSAMVAGAAVLVLSGCGAADARIAAVVKGLDNPFFQTMWAGIEERAAAGRVDVTVRAANSITDTAGQAATLHDLAGQDSGCVIVNPITGTNLIPGIAALSAQKVPIVNIDSPVDAAAAAAAGATIATYIGTDNTDAGARAAAQMATLLPGGGTLALIGGTDGDVTSAARIDGFTRAVPAELKIISSVAADWNRQMALTKAADILTANPELSGFFVANDEMGLGVARAVADRGRTGRTRVISVDGTKDALAAVKAGGIDAVVAQFPYVIGAMGVEACSAALAGKTLPENVKAPIQVVTAANVDAALTAAPKPAGGYDDPFADLSG